MQIGFTPLHLAIENKHDALVALLIRLGADPDTPNKVRYMQISLQGIIRAAGLLSSTAVAWPLCGMLDATQVTCKGAYVAMCLFEVRLSLPDVCSTTVMSLISAACAILLPCKACE